MDVNVRYVGHYWETAPVPNPNPNPNPLGAGRAASASGPPACSAFAGELNSRTLDQISYSFCTTPAVRCALPARYLSPLSPPRPLRGAVAGWPLRFSQPAVGAVL